MTTMKYDSKLVTLLGETIKKDSSGIIFTKGLPGSGKSFFAKELADKYPGEVIRINKDDLRAMFNQGKHSSGKEDLMNAARKAMVREILAKNKWVICDDTNLTASSATLYKSMSKNVVEVDFLDIPVDVCIERDLNRTRSVGKDVILKMWESTLKPLVQDKSRPKAVIFDLDGTLAHNQSNSRFFDPTRYLEDKPIEGAVLMAHALISSGTQVIFVSGREGTKDGRESTETWLKDQGFDMTKCPLFMRKERDFRKDNIVKEEIFMGNIYNKYYVAAVFDDRDQVCRMWRSLGITLFKCGPSWDFDLV